MHDPAGDVSHHYSHVLVSGVVDGDTIDVVIDYGFHIAQAHRVRLGGIDAPETRAVGPEGEASRDWLRELLPVGKAVELVTDKPRDKFGRYLAWVYIYEPDGSLTNVNEAIVEAGHAVRYDGGTR